MPLMSCPKCGQNVSSLASVCPQCSFPLREQRLKESQMGPQITCRKCDHLISANARVCPHCGVDFPKKTFNLLIAAVPIAAIVLVFAIMKLWPSGEGTAYQVPQQEEQPAESLANPVSLPEASDTVTETTPIIDTIVPTPAVITAPPVMAASPNTPDTTFGSNTRWTADWTNVREGPASNTPSLRVLGPGQRVEVGTFVRGWWEVFIDGELVGYVANSLLLREPPNQ